MTDAQTPISIQPFVNAAARDARIPSPVVGQGAFLIDTGSLVFYYGKYHGWQKAWNTGWGEVARTVDVGSDTIAIGGVAESEIASARTPFSAVQNRQYRISASCVGYNNNAASPGADLVTFYLRDSPTGPLFELSRGITFDRLANEAPVRFTVETTTSIFGSHVVAFSVLSPNAAGVTLVTGSWPIEVVVEDIGSLGPPVYG